MNPSQTLRTQAVEADIASTRTETWRGRDYLVVPIVALVEGVIQGANSEVPELVRIQTMKKAPQGWNGRPIVMNHPQVNGEYVSANSPDVLEDWHFGFMFNTLISGKKLVTEAWIDTARAEELGGDFAETVGRIQNGQMVEVSTGLYTEVDLKAAGRFNQKAYQGEWQTIIPDHLALLSNGATGACSIADGCGTHRVNAAQHPKQASLHVNCDGECTCGGGSMSDASTERGRIASAFDTFKAVVLGAINVNTGDQVNEGQRNEGLGRGPGAGEGSERSGELHGDGASEGSVGIGGELREEHPVGENAGDGESGQGGTGEELLALSSILTHSVAPDLVFCDIEKIVRTELKEYLGMNGPRSYVLLMTTDHVVYTTEAYDYYYSPQYGGGGTYRQAYTIDGNGNVTFAGMPEEVNVITRIVPITADDNIEVNSNSNPEVVPMADPVTPAEPIATPASGSTAPTTLAAPKVQTMAEYLASAPLELRETLQEGMRLQKARKDDLISAIKANADNKFTDEVLAGFDTPTLDNIAALAKVTPSYEGRGTPEPQVNRGSEDTQCVPAPDVFARPVANAA